MCEPSSVKRLDGLVRDLYFNSSLETSYRVILIRFVLFLSFNLRTFPPLDTSSAGQLSTKVADLCGKVQDGLGRKAGDMIQFTTQIICSFIVGLYLSWELTLVLLAAFPLIGFAGYFMITAATAAQNEGSEQYANAGSQNLSRH